MRWHTDTLPLSVSPSHGERLSEEDDLTRFVSERRRFVLSRSEVSVEEEVETKSDLTKLTLWIINSLSDLAGQRVKEQNRNVWLFHLA